MASLQRVFPINSRTLLSLLLALILISRASAYLVFLKRSDFNRQFSPLEELEGEGIMERIGSGKSRRSVQPSLMMALPDSEDVCTPNIKYNHKPTHAHDEKGRRVEIEQDGEVQFMATYIECNSAVRKECHGIDKSKFSSECVTSYEGRLASIRPAGSDEPFSMGHIQVPIMCQCRVRRILHV